MLLRVSCIGTVCSWQHVMSSCVHALSTALASGSTGVKVLCCLWRYKSHAPFGHVRSVLCRLHTERHQRPGLVRDGCRGNESAWQCRTGYEMLPELSGLCMYQKLPTGKMRHQQCDAGSMAVLLTCPSRKTALPQGPTPPRSRCSPRPGG
jgi:hypothetical protein